MARKIIPLKHASYKKQKGSPVKKVINWFGDEDFGQSGMETEFGTLKQGLMDTDVTQNFYKDIKNPYAGLDDPFASLQNVAEDLTVDQKKFEQQERTLQRGLSQTLQSSKQTGTQNTQAIANQLAKSSGDIAADIGAQEQTNRQLTTKAAHELVSGELARSDAKAEGEKGFLGVNWSF